MVKDLQIQSRVYIDNDLPHMVSIRLYKDDSDYHILTL